jgi:hypothetical protein
VARDLLLGTSSRDWSRGSLPAAAQGYVPRKWWTEAEAEAEVQRHVKGSGILHPPLPRELAEKTVLDYMKANKIGVTSTSGSILIPSKQQREFFAKIDDVRYDLRQTGRNVGTTVLVLSAALGAVAVASVYRTSSGR